MSVNSVGYAGAFSVLLSDVVDLDLFNRMVNLGYVKVRSHPENEGLKICCYSRQAQFEGKWNDATKTARGLIVFSLLDDFSDAVVVARPWRKFFTLAQMSDAPDGRKAWALGDEENNYSGVCEAARLDFSAPVEVTDKLDGSMMVLFKDFSGGYSLASKGSFNSVQVEVARRLRLENPVLDEVLNRLGSDFPDKTFCFELVGPSNPIVLAYGEDKLVFTGVIDTVSGVYESVNDYPLFAEAGFDVAETVNAGCLAEVVALPDRFNREGVVARFISGNADSQLMVKFKQDDYLELHRLMFALSPKRVLSLMESGEWEGVLAKIPVRVNGRFVEFTERVNAMVAEFTDRVTSVYHAIPEGLARKDFALYVQSNVDEELWRFMFALYNMRDIDLLVLRHVFKRFDEDDFCF